MRGVYLDPMFDGIQRKCWTSDHYLNISDRHAGAWIVSFEHGKVEEAYWLDKATMPGARGWSYKNEMNYVKAVRSLK